MGLLPMRGRERKRRRKENEGGGDEKGIGREQWGSKEGDTPDFYLALARHLRGLRPWTPLREFGPQTPRVIVPK